MQRVSLLAIIGKAVGTPKASPVVVQKPAEAPRLIRQRVCAMCDAVYIRG